MLKYLMASTAVVAMLAATPVTAEQKTQDRQQTQTMQNGSVSFVSSQSESEWLGSVLIGRTVLNGKGESLGDINNIVVDESGNVTAVVIGVGGFLGLGEKDVGVEFSALEFKTDTPETPIRKDSEKLRTQTPAENPAMNPQTAEEQRANNSGKTAEERRNMQLQKTAREQAQRNEADHGDMIIVLNTTKEQLESAPAYKYLGEERETPEPRDPANTTNPENEKRN